jgi:hypothetical protein
MSKSAITLVVVVVIGAFVYGQRANFARGAGTAAPRMTHYLTRVFKYRLIMLHLGKGIVKMMQ